MTTLPSLDDYDVQGVAVAEAAFWADDVRASVEGLADAITNVEWDVGADG
ncbi:hypothetical protein [Streptomyces sp. NPDC006638]